MTPVLEAEKLGKRYGQHQALTDCDLSIPQGRVIGLVGPNGAGKSTLLNLACGLIQPTAGASRCSAPARPRTPPSWPGSASSHRTPPCTPACPSPTICGSAPG